MPPMTEMMPFEKTRLPRLLLRRRRGNDRRGGLRGLPLEKPCEWQRDVFL